MSARVLWDRAVTTQLQDLRTTTPFCVIASPVPTKRDSQLLPGLSGQKRGLRAPRRVGQLNAKRGPEKTGCRGGTPTETHWTF